MNAWSWRRARSGSPYLFLLFRDDEEVGTVAFTVDLRTPVVTMNRIVDVLNADGLAVLPLTDRTVDL